MGRLVMARLEVNEEELGITISEVQRIREVPSAVKQLIKDKLHGRRLLKSGLPSVRYLAADRIQVIGAFTYGELSFLEIEGKWSKIEGKDLTCITAYRENKDYKELVEGRDAYVKALKKKYPEGCKVEN